ncbi:hypothetical protein J6590_051822 [Homalodisca vitripennis]|nr:hypothetical protein J6590_051822 [Homalodisca vitripennis]
MVADSDRMYLGNLTATGNTISNQALIQEPDCDYAAYLVYYIDQWWQIVIECIWEISQQLETQYRTKPKEQQDCDYGVYLVYYIEEWWQIMIECIWEISQQLETKYRTKH